MESVIAQVKQLAATTNEAGRKEIMDQLRELSNSLETPDETLQRIMYLVSFCHNIDRKAQCLIRLSSTSKSQWPA